MELDDWELSTDELDSLERDALKQIAQRNSSSSAAAAATSTSSSIPSHSRQQLQQQQQHHSAHFNPQCQYSHSVLIAESRPKNKVDASPSASRILTASTEPKATMLSVKFFLHATGNIAAKFLYDQEPSARSPKLAGMQKRGLLCLCVRSWKRSTLWMLPISSLSSAEKVLTELSGFKVEVESLDPLARHAIIAASAVPDLRDRYDMIPGNVESKLLPFQRDGVRFVLQHGGRVLLADEMGLGKTLQAIAVTTCIRDAWPVLVLTPSSLRLHWASMIQQWLNIPSSDILVVLSQCGGSNRAGFTIVHSNTKGSIHLDGMFNILSYDVVPKLQNILMASEFKVVIADESHFLKNGQAKRTSASLPILQKAQYAILLSGTPALSRPIELFKQLEALYPNVYKNVHEFGNRYCKGGIFGVYQGASNHEELHNLMKATLMIRRLKRDVLSELPVKRRQQVFLDLAEKDMRQINALFRELEVVKNKIRASQSKEEAESLKFSEKHLINKAGCKFLIFAHHQPMIDSIYQFLQKKKVGCIRIDGSTAAASRQALVTDFQEKDSIKAAVLSIKAGGVGITLTAASTVIFAELSWTPGDIIQAEDRAHRIGQVSSVNVYYLLANDTVDDIIWDVVQSKLENLGQMLDGHERTLEVSSSQPKSSPAKQRALDSFGSQPESSPAKQRTLNSFVKRCSNMNGFEHQPQLKYPRHGD
ncbi:uncharacterized protein LOC131324346 isoform X4 [Rhododendron vialii]|uniref:uncharacterized protein LOC131324346 isoform X4 n=1 Tax=Rhododendron vialii TaxID=182163 RepID=UPI00265F3524|nr:uncharacterized protein LOC131324346 isoform X4 [Rhododendron vialii]